MRDWVRERVRKVWANPYVRVTVIFVCVMAVAVLVSETLLADFGQGSLTYNCTGAT